MNVIVTGGSGFVGSHVVDVLAEAGHRVTVIDRRPPLRPGVFFRRADLLDLDALVRAMRGAEQVFHLAAISNVNEAMRAPQRCVAVNVLGTARVLEAAQRCGVRRVHLASTVWVYSASPAGGVLDEKATLDAGSSLHVYTASKIAAEMLCRSHENLYGLPFTILRYGIPYGPRMREELLIPKFLRKAVLGEPLPVAGNGSQSRNFVHVRDLAHAHLSAMKDVAANRVYNLDGREPVTVLQVAEAIGRILGRELPVEVVDARPGDLDGRTISSERSRRELGWTPQVGFDEGLRDTVAWFTEQWSSAREARRG